MRCRLGGRPSTGGLTFHLLLGGFDVGHHAGHVHAIPVQVLQEDIRIPPGKRASLGDEAEHRVHRVHTDMSSLCTTDRSTGFYHTSEASIWPVCSLENTKAESHCNKKKQQLSLGALAPMKPAAMLRATRGEVQVARDWRWPLGCSLRGSEAFLPNLTWRWLHPWPIPWSQPWEKL